MQLYGESSFVATNSNWNSKSDLPFCFGIGRDTSRFLGTKPCEVGSVVRIKCWLRIGTWNTAQPRGT